MTKLDEALARLQRGEYALTSAYKSRSALHIKLTDAKGAQLSIELFGSNNWTVKDGLGDSLGRVPPSALAGVSATLRKQITAKPSPDEGDAEALRHLDWIDGVHRQEAATAALRAAGTVDRSVVEGLLRALVDPASSIATINEPVTSGAEMSLSGGGSQVKLEAPIAGRTTLLATVDGRRSAIGKAELRELKDALFAKLDAYLSGLQKTYPPGNAYLYERENTVERYKTGFRRLLID
jgi:hypothetical protein